MTTAEISCGQRTGVADAGGAAVADEVEAERLQRRGQAGPIEVFGDDLRAWRERGLHPRLRAQAARERVAGEDSRADHHGRVGGVGAAGDGRDHDVTVVELDLGAVRRASQRAALAALDRDAAVGGPFHEARAPVVGPWPVVAVGGRVARGEALGGGLVARRRSPGRSRRAPRGRTREPARAGRDPAGAWARRGSARRRRGRARSCPRRSAPRSSRRATDPAPWRRPRRARSAHARVRTARGR